MAVKPFSSEQKFYIESGNKNAARLKTIIETALGVAKKKVEVKRHTYVYSPPGAGKTFTVQTTADGAKITPLKIQGASSINALVVKLATAVYSIPEGNIIVWVDDCDTLFMDTEGLNVMKGVLDEERNILEWNKNLTVQILTYEKSKEERDLLIARALRSFQPVGEVGISIPMDRCRFIITSNKNLCPPADVFTRKGNKKNNMHEAAIRDRVNYEEFELNGKESWGWTASILLNSKALSLKPEQKHILLDWMWENWAKLPAHSMRAVMDRAADMLNHPDDYPDYWNAVLRK